MAKLKIRTYPDPILKKGTQIIKQEEIKGSKIQKLISEMFKFMAENNGLGLAAPQIGKSIKLCLIKFGEDKYVLINPKIISKSWRKEICEEGCLSFPGKYIPIKRPKKVTVKAIDEHGHPFKVTADGLFSKALQHEIDHLNGVLFIEHEVKKKKNG